MRSGAQCAFQGWVAVAVAIAGQGLDLAEESVECRGLVRAQVCGAAEQRYGQSDICAASRHCPLSAQAVSAIWRVSMVRNGAWCTSSGRLVSTDSLLAAPKVPRLAEEPEHGRNTRGWGRGRLEGAHAVTVEAAITMNGCGSIQAAPKNPYPPDSVPQAIGDARAGTSRTDS